MTDELWLDETVKPLASLEQQSEHLWLRLLPNISLVNRRAVTGFRSITERGCLVSTVARPIWQGVGNC